ncbi:MAG: nitrogenase molybdenum-iron cofactor biosynthesis protein, partial [Methanimicrococcus sp.]|nr:nitrogenase molybdenum-iron cofactor biosynthesis protein [Methanimicrococcus sp.]
MGEEMKRKIAQHPCYSSEAQHKFGRLHLPVAPSCNIQCNYCD